MPAVKGRGRRTASGLPTVILQARVDPVTRTLAGKRADETGMSMAAYIEALVLADAERGIIPPVPRPAGFQEFDEVSA